MKSEFWKFGLNIDPQYPPNTHHRGPCPLPSFLLTQTSRPRSHVGLFRDLAGLGRGPFHPHRWVSWEAWKGARETCLCSSHPVVCGRPISVTYSAINVSHLLDQSVSFRGQGPGCASLPASPCLLTACSSLGSPVLASQRRRGSAARLLV